MIKEQWIALTDLVSGKPVENFLTGFTIESPWIPGWYYPVIVKPSSLDGFLSKVIEKETRIEIYELSKGRRQKIQYQMNTNGEQGFWFILDGKTTKGTVRTFEIVAVPYTFEEDKLQVAIDVLEWIRKFTNIWILYNSCKFVDNIRKAQTIK